MSIECSCITCRKIYSIKGIHTHYERNHAPPEVKAKYPSGNHGKYDEISTKIAENKNKEILEYNKNPKLCLECNTPIDFEHRDSKSGCCSASCAAKLSNRQRNESGWTLSLESRSQIRNSLEEHRKIHGNSSGRKRIPDIHCICEHCGISFKKKRKQRFCSKKCSNMFRTIITEKTRTPFVNYRAKCNFKFNLKDYPDKFDFSLIEQYGWYSAANHGNNLTGVSRDHMISVRYGFDNNIDPELISHPANCQLLQHNINSSKFIRCSLTLDELKERIEKWSD